MSDEQGDDAADAADGDSTVTDPEAEFYGDVGTDADSDDGADGTDADADTADGADDTTDANDETNVGAEDEDEEDGADDAATDGVDEEAEADEVGAEDEDETEVDGETPEADTGDDTDDAAEVEAADDDEAAADDAEDEPAEADDAEDEAEAEAEADDEAEAEAEEAVEADDEADAEDGADETPDDDEAVEADDTGETVDAEEDPAEADDGVTEADQDSPEASEAAAEDERVEAGADDGEDEDVAVVEASGETADADDGAADGSPPGESEESADEQEDEVDEVDEGEDETDEADDDGERPEEPAPVASADGEASAGMLAGSAASGGAGVTVTDPDTEFYTDPLVGEDPDGGVAVPPDAERAASVDEAALQEATAALWRGDLVVYPTETVYGLAADALDERAVRRLFEVKGRDRSNPVSIAVPDVNSALEYVAPSTRTRRFMREFLPGPVTVVCERRARVPDAVTAGSDRVGVRIPDEPTAIALLRRVAPLTATSANLSGTENARRVADLDPAVREAVAVVLDGGETPGGESTVVDVERAEVIRPGLQSEAVRDWLDGH